MRPLQSDIDEIVSTTQDIKEMFAGKRVLITGGRGFLGRYFADVLLKFNETLSSPVDILSLDNCITSGEAGKAIQDAPNFRAIKHNVIQPFPMGSATDKNYKIDYILHAAGIASPFYYRKYPLETLEVATTGLKNSLLVAEEHKAKILFFSSSEIYGDPDSRHVPTPESYRGNVSCLGPRSCYDESKRLGETLVRIFHEQRGVHGTIVRPFNVHGPMMQQTDYRVLPNFMSRILSGLPVHVYGSGNQTRTFCYVTDAIRGFLQVLVNGVSGEPYNIGNPTPEISMLQLAERLSAFAPVKIDTIEYPDSYPADEPNRRCPDISKAAVHVGYKPVIDLDTGLRRFFDWAKENYSTT